MPTRMGFMDVQEVDLLVIGAGPHALSLLCRLVDDDPDLLSERDRTHIIQKAGARGRPHKDVRKHLKCNFDGAKVLESTVVIDHHGQWMAQWKRDFEALNIRYARSHADLHPCPFDFQSLRVWAEMKNRQSEMWPMRFIDREASRKAGYAGPYILPGRELFFDFCDDLVHRYNLSPLVQAGDVVAVRVLEATGGDCAGFEVGLADGRLFRARRVVSAMGPGPAFKGMRATLPWWADDLKVELVEAGEGERMAHSQALVPRLLAEVRSEGGLQSSLAGRRVLVVGGGQTSAHLAMLACEAGAKRVVVAARRRCFHACRRINPAAGRRHRHSPAHPPALPLTRKRRSVTHSLCRYAQSEFKAFRC